MKRKSMVRGWNIIGLRKGLVMVIVGSLYGLKSAGDACRAQIAQRMSDIRFAFCLSNTYIYIWIRNA